MFSIESREEAGGRWISGIWLHRQAAEGCRQGVPESSRKFHRVVEIPLSRFPIFILEENGFQYGDLNWICKKIQKLSAGPEIGDVLCTIYAVREEFSPEDFSADEMGALPHWHVTLDMLRPAQLKALVQKITQAVRSEEK